MVVYVYWRPWPTKSLQAQRAAPRVRRRRCRRPGTSPAGLAQAQATGLALERPRVLAPVRGQSIQGLVEGEKSANWRGILENAGHSLDQDL
jgi:hypothetical protein